MLTMTVMQHEGAAAQCSTEPPEVEDVLSRLRHLHQTLQECHWRVQVVDHALCAQSDRGQHGPNNQTKNNLSFEIQSRKECSLKNAAKNSCSLQLGTGKDQILQNKAIKEQDLDKHFKEVFSFKKHLEDDVFHSQSKEDQSCQKEDGEESQNQFCGDCTHQKAGEEKHSLLDITIEKQSVSVQVEGSIQALSSDAERNLNYTADDSDLTINDCMLHDNVKKENYIHNETNEEDDIQNSNKDPCRVDNISLLERKQKKCLTRQNSIDLDDDDPLLADAITLPSHDSSHPNAADEISPVSSTMTDISECSLQPDSANAKFSDLLLKQEDVLVGHHEEKVRYRCDSVHDLENKLCDEGSIKFHKKQKEDNTFQDSQEKSKEVRGMTFVSKLPIVDPYPEVAQRMDVIWEALGNLQSHFFALHSSLLDSSSLFCSEKFGKSSDNYHITCTENEPITKCTKLHSVHEDLTSEATQPHQAPCEQSLHRKFPVRTHSHCVCQDLPRSQISSHVSSEEPANSAGLSHKSTHRKAYLQDWRSNCLCIAVMVLLVLLFLFLASCLLLLLPVVSVSVRTAGGLPAF